MKIAIVLVNEFIANERKRIFSFIGKKAAYAPTTLTTLASLVPEDLKASVEIIDEFVTPFDPETIQADLVGISFTTPNAIRAYTTADILRNRGISVILGGYHVTAMPEEAAQHADATVLGFAEESWPKLLRDFCRGNLESSYKSTFKNGFSVLEVTERCLLKKRKYFYPDTLEFSRSCNNACTFCVIPEFSGKGMAYRSEAVLLSDLKRMEGKDIVFLDSSPTENLEAFRSLCNMMKNLRIRWYSAITCKLAKHPEIIELMAGSGCRGVLVGFETLNHEPLEKYDKGFNAPEKYRDLIDIFHYYKIYVFGSFIFGFDGEDRSVFQSTIDFIDSCAIDLVHPAILTPFPGTQLFIDLKRQNRILTYDWSKYDGLHVTYEPEGMTGDELQAGFKWVYLKTHSIKSIIKRSMCSQASTMTTFLGNICLGYYGKKVLN